MIACYAVVVGAIILHLDVRICGQECEVIQINEMIQTACRFEFSFREGVQWQSAIMNLGECRQI